MALSGGSREILEAARKRLSTAKAQATAASTNLASIKQMLINAQSMSDAADKDAQTALDEAEKKYEVIDIDDEPETPTAEGSNKRRKVSLSPQANNNNILILPSFGIRRSPDGRARGRNVGELDIINGTSTARNNTIPTSISFAAGSSSSNVFTNNLHNNASTSNGDQILFAVPGDPEVSGVYKQENGSLYAGAPVFTKRVRSNTFAIYRVPSNQKYWYIGHWNRNTNSEMPSSRLFKSNLYTRESRLIPPDEGWVSCSAALSSQQVPKSRFLSAVASSSVAATAVNELVVSGCGLLIANGTYKRTNKLFNGLPRYTKTAGEITFTISSIFDEYSQYWRISQVDTRSIYKCVVKDRVGGKLDGAPLDNSTWYMVSGRGGLQPPPQVKRG